VSCTEAPPTGYCFDVSTAGALFFGSGVTVFSSGPGHSVVKAGYGTAQNVFSTVPGTISVDYVNNGVIVDTFLAQPFSTTDFSD